MSGSQHWYNIEGDLVDPWTPGALPSVSTILDRIRNDEREALVRRIGVVEADELMTRAAERGTRIHAAVEWCAKRYLQEEALTHYDAMVDDTLQNNEEDYLQGFMRWSTKYVKRFIFVEFFARSKKYRYAGRMDLVVEMKDGSLWVIDVKTGQDSVRHGLQLKMYAQALYERTGYKVRMGVLALDASLKCGYRHSKQEYGVKEYKEPWSACLAHINVFKWWSKKKPAKAPVDASLIWSPRVTEEGVVV